jgi:hypothetical protein
VQWLRRRKENHLWFSTVGYETQNYKQSAWICRAHKEKIRTKNKILALKINDAREKGKIPVSEP